MSRKKKRTKKEQNKTGAETKQEPDTSTKPADAGQAGQKAGSDDDQILKDVANFLTGKWIKLQYQEWCSVLRIVRNPRVHQLTEEQRQTLTQLTVAGSAESHTASWLRGIKKLQYTLFY